jgi:hypothetical protein
MSAHFPDDRADVFEVIRLTDLPLDLRRALCIQFKEFIHHIEDVQEEAELPHNPRVLNFLERCYRRAA